MYAQLKQYVFLMLQLQRPTPTNRPGGGSFELEHLLSDRSGDFALDPSAHGVFNLYRTHRRELLSSNRLDGVHLGASRIDIRLVQRTRFQSFALYALGS